MAVSGPRWKQKCAEATALADPMSKIIASLQSSLIQSRVRGVIWGRYVNLEVGHEQADLLKRACFGVTKDEQLFQLSLEEAFYLSHSLKCLEIVGEDKCLRNNDELWECMKLKRNIFPYLYKAYSHLRSKHWVLRSGFLYGVDFVAYRHHPSLVHSEYAVLVKSDSDNSLRLREWSDIHCTVRLCGGVAKTLLVVHINENGSDVASSSCLEHFEVQERTITRWSANRSREDKKIVKNGTGSAELVKRTPTPIKDYTNEAPLDIIRLRDSNSRPPTTERGCQPCELAHVDIYAVHYIRSISSPTSNVFTSESS